MPYQSKSIPALTDNQRRLASRYEAHNTDTISNNGKRVPRMVPMLTEAACFQPMQPTYDFKKGIAKDQNGKDMYSGKKPIMERELIAAHKEQVKNALKQQYGDNWKHVFQHPTLYSRTAR